MPVSCAWASASTRSARGCGSGAFTRGRRRAMIDQVRGSLRGVTKRDVAIAAILSALGVVLMLLNVIGADRLAAGRMVDPDQRAAVHIGNLIPFAFAVP